MKRTRFQLFFWLNICLAFIFPFIAQAYTLDLETTSDGITSKSVFSQGDSFYLNIIVNNATGIAGCSFTLNYPSSILQAPQISSEGLPVNPNDITSFFGFTFIKNGTTYLTNRGNVVPSDNGGKLYFSGAAIDTNTGGAKTVPGGKMVLLTVKFLVKPDAPFKNIYTITLSPTTLNNTQAGYSASGETLPVLIGAVDKNNTAWGNLTAAFPTLLKTMNVVPKTFALR